jgi:hypothetical protein
MGIPVMILGESGSGKTYSIKNLNPDEVGIFLVEKPRLPFRKQFKVAKNASYSAILKTLAAPNLKTYVIDDSQYLLVNEFFDRANEVGYQKFTDLALNFRNLIHFVARKTPDDVIVYFLHHTEADVNGRVKAKTIGRMLDEKLTVEGLFDIVLRTEVTPEGHFFRTQTNGNDTVKTPEDMFPERIPNDLALVDRTIREYYFGTAETKETEEE